MYYNKSLRSPTTEQQLKALDYSILGDMNFDRSQYKIAGAYYDSTLANYEPNTRIHRLFKRKRDNLEDVIFMKTSPNATIVFWISCRFRKLIDLLYSPKWLKNQVKRWSLKKDQEAAKRDNTGITQSIAGAPQGRAAMDTGQQESSFYFYNQTSVAFGKTNF